MSRRIEKIVEEKRVELGVPGAALVIVKDDKVIFMKGFGLCDIERRLPVTKVIAGRIFKSLNMNASNLSVRDLRKSRDFAYGYDFTNIPDGKGRRFPLYDFSNITATGGFNSNARDMGWFLRLILGKGVIDGKRLLSEKSFKEMLTPQIKIGVTGYWALVWSFIGSRKGHRIFFTAALQKVTTNNVNQE